MGIPYTVRLILPKVIALAIAMPLLILWTTGVALLGGAIAAQVQLGLTVSQFLLSLPAAVPGVNLALARGVGLPRPPGRCDCPRASAPACGAS